MNSIANLLCQLDPPALGQATGSTNACPLLNLEWPQLLDLSVRNGKLVLSLGPLLVAIGAAVAIWLTWRAAKNWRSPVSGWDTKSIKIKFGDLFEQEIAPNHDTVRIAYAAWIEISTRKVGLPFDEDHDVLVEVYDSWYQLFTILRDLTKSVPAHRLRECSDTQTLVNNLLRVLNEGLRPHLTRWQAKFRKWYAQALEMEKNKSPQEIQRLYPEYDALIKDLKNVNIQFVEFSKSLRDLAYGKKG